MFNIAAVLFGVIVISMQQRIVILHETRGTQPRSIHDPTMDYVIALCSRYDIPTKNVGETSCLCTGTLLKRRWVLTAAQCLHENITKVRYGAMENLSHDGQYSEILKKIPYPAYRENIHEHRSHIGLAYIEPIQLYNYGHISKTTYQRMLGCEVKIVRMENILTKDYRRYLQYVTDKRLENGDNLKLMRNAVNNRLIFDALVVQCPHHLFGRYICVEARYDNDVPVGYKEGDVGAPLLHGGLVVGVASPPEKGVKELIHTAVSPYYDWVMSMIDVRYKYAIALRKVLRR